MIQQFFLPAIQERDLDNSKLQQDGATAHNSEVSTVDIDMPPDSSGRVGCWNSRGPKPDRHQIHNHLKLADFQSKAMSNIQQVFGDDTIGLTSMTMRDIAAAVEAVKSSVSRIINQQKNFGAVSPKRKRKYGSK
ncbi:hypothetical protein TNCV_1900101 [Trichonephila clavipes]|nr:hypothetical protein TNCV_1900101 [Trichonephila clavipes]